MKRLIICFSFCFIVHGATLEVSSHKMSFKLDYDQDKISLESLNSKIKVNKVKCNQEAFEIFLTKFNQKFKKKVLMANSERGISLKHNKKSYVINPNSSLGQYLFKMHESVMALKIQEDKGCD
jgi:hypothetical protein